jgi:hypothetical protein
VDHGVFEPDHNDGDFAIALIEATMATAQSSIGAIWSRALARWLPVDCSMRPDRPESSRIETGCLRQLRHD